MTDFVVVNYAHYTYRYRDLIIYKGLEYFLNDDTGIPEDVGVYEPNTSYCNNHIRKLTRLEKLIYFGEKE